MGMGIGKGGMERRLQSASDSIKKTATIQRPPWDAKEDLSRKKTKESRKIGNYYLKGKNTNHEGHETSRKIKALKELLGSPVGSRPIKFQALHF